ncbi:MAG: hypothetical protein JW929_10175 [Anaerolineales bacterium]|nr:hypothetical protein [Anaerolineales bacterium]
MPELPKETQEIPQEKPEYEAPVVVELSAIQRGEGGLPVGCFNGSAATPTCSTGSLVF